MDHLASADRDRSGRAAPERGGARPPRGRYAPSPTGEIHLGNASTALVAWLAARSRGGAFVMRMEDLDRPRVVAGAAERILRDLAWLGLDWDEGPDRGGPHAPYDQWSRREHYDRAFARLVELGAVYPCFCSRKDVAAAASAPQAPGVELRYPGSCRSVSREESARRIQLGTPHAWRFRADEESSPSFLDLVRGAQDGTGRSAGDFVVRRADGVPAYQLAVVVDDAAMEIDEVVRGDDLLPSTHRQRALQEALALPVPRYAHVPLLLGSDGVRLSKRHRGATLRELREAGTPPERIVGRLAALLGLTRDDRPIAAGDLLGDFSFERVARVPSAIAVDPAGW